MGELRDPELENKERVLTEEIAIPSFSVPAQFRSIPQSVQDVVAAYLQLIWAIKKNGKNISVDKIIDNARLMFSAEMRYKDKFWKEHCATTLREISCDLTPDDYHKSLKHIPIQDPEIKQTFDKLYTIKSCLSDIVHLRLEASLKHARNILSDQTIQDGEKAFELVCIELIYVHFFLFNKYCYEAID